MHRKTFKSFAYTCNNMDIRFGLLFCCVLLVPSCVGESILLLPGSFPSHWSWMVRLGRELRQRHHEVYAVVRASPDMIQGFQKVGVSVLPYQILPENKTMGERLAETVLHMCADGPPSVLDIANQSKAMMQITKEEERYIFDDVVLRKKLQGMHFDLAIVDGTPTNMYLLTIPYALDIPYISCTMAFMNHIFGLPSLPSFHPMTFWPFSDKMSFLQRLANLLCFLGEIPLAPVVFQGTIGGHVKKYAPEKPETSPIDIARKSRLFLVHLAIPLDYPRVSLPHVVMTGPWTFGPAQHLEKKFLSWMDARMDTGVVVFSLGSVMSTLPRWFTQRLLEAFSRVGIPVIGRYSAIGNLTLPSNVWLLPWIPQNDLLAHPATKLFVSHCGNNGMYESIFHGVPMVGIPLYGDHFYNCHRITDRGFGEVLHLSSLSEGKLSDAMLRVINNSDTYKATQSASAVMKSDPKGPLDKAIYWIEHVLQHGADHLRSPALDMSWYTFYCIDCLIVLTVVLTLLAWAVVRILKYICNPDTASIQITALNHKHVSNNCNHLENNNKTKVQ